MGKLDRIREIVFGLWSFFFVLLPGGIVLAGIILLFLILVLNQIFPGSADAISQWIAEEQ